MPALQVVNLLGVEGSLIETSPNSERWLESTEKPIEVVSMPSQNQDEVTLPIKYYVRHRAGPSQVLEKWERLAGGLNSDLRHLVNSWRSSRAGGTITIIKTTKEQTNHKDQE